MVTIGVKADGSIGPVAEETLSAKGKGQKQPYACDQREATLNLEGHVELKAGNTLSLTGFGRLSTNWLVTAARHDIDR